MLYILGNFAVHALTIFHKRNLLIPKLSIIFLQKFLVIILQNVSEYSHDPFDSFENDYKCPVLLSIMSDFRFIFFLSSLAIYRETNSDTSQKEFLKA